MNKQISTIGVHKETKKLMMKLMNPQETYEKCIIRVFNQVIKNKEV